MPWIQIVFAFSQFVASLQLQEVDCNLHDDVSLLQVRTALVGRQDENTQALEKDPADRGHVSQKEDISLLQLSSNAVIESNGAHGAEVVYNASLFSLESQNASLPKLPGTLAENHGVYNASLSRFESYNSSLPTPHHPSAEVSPQNHGIVINKTSAATLVNHSINPLFDRKESLTSLDSHNATLLIHQHPKAEAEAVSVERVLNASLTAVLENHSKNLGFARDNLDAVSLTHNFSVSSLYMAEVKSENTALNRSSEASPENLSKEHELVRNGSSAAVAGMLENHSAELGFLLHDPTKVMQLKNHSEDLGFVHVTAPKGITSKKQGNSGAIGTHIGDVEVDHSDSRDAKLEAALDLLAWELQHNRALSFQEHRPSAEEVAARQSGLTVLVAGAGLCVVVGMAIAFLWVLQCSKLCTRSVTPTARENFDQQVLADVYNKAQSRPRMRPPDIVETVAESSRVLRWVAGKRSVKTHSHEPADFFEESKAAQRWYDN